MPFDLSKRILRLAAVMNLVDHEIHDLRDKVKTESAATWTRVETAKARDYKYILINDDVSLLAAAAGPLKRQFRILRQLGRDAGFPPTGFPELALLGFESESFLMLAPQVGIYTLEDLRDECEAAASKAAHLAQLKLRLDRSRHTPDTDDGHHRALSDRPLFVLEVALLFDHLSVVNSLLKSEVKQAIGEVQRSIDADSEVA